MNVPGKNSFRERIEVIWKTKTELISANSKYIFLPIPGNPQTLLINKINTFSSQFSETRDIRKKHVKL